MAYAVWHICEVGKRSCSVFTVQHERERRVESGGTEGCITQVAECCFAQERRALAIARRSRIRQSLVARASSLTNKLDPFVQP